ncbi:MAG: hypothetical protein ACREJ4_11845 [Candidatus Methylomirabilaceae bacterium]
MGWLFTYNSTKQDLIRARTAPWETELARGEILAYCVRGNGLWKVVEVEDQRTGEKERYIALDRLAYDKGSRGWGYKDLYESDHPYYYDCPLGYLAQVPVECEKGREGVQAQHARIHRRIEIGQRIALSGSRIPWVRIVSVRPLRGEYRGTVHRLPRALLGEVLPESVP